MIFATDLMWECMHGPPLKYVMDDNSCYVVDVNSAWMSKVQSCLSQNWS